MIQFILQVFIKILVQGVVVSSVLASRSAKILRILLKWSFAFLRSSQLSNHFRLWPVITLWSWDVTYKTTTSLFFPCWFSHQLRSPLPSKLFSFKSFNYSGGFVLFLKSSIVPSSQVHVLFFPCSVRVLPKSFQAYSFLISF